TVTTTKAAFEDWLRLAQRLFVVRLPLLPAAEDQAERSAHTDVFEALSILCERIGGERFGTYRCETELLGKKLPLKDEQVLEGQRRILERLGFSLDRSLRLLPTLGQEGWPESLRANPLVGQTTRRTVLADQIRQQANRFAQVFERLVELRVFMSASVTPC